MSDLLGISPDCLREELIAATLRWARDRSPFYAQRFAGLDFNKPLTLDSLRSVPILTREQVRQEGEAMLCDELHISHV